MDFKLVSKDGDFLPLLKRIQDEGHNVKAYLESGSRMYDGILPKADNAIDLDITPGDIVLYDMVGAGESAEVLKRKKYTVIGGGRLNDMIELDRGEGARFMTAHGLKVPHRHSFVDFQDMREFLESNPHRYVFKPNGNLDTSLTFVSRSAEELLAMIPYLEDECPADVTFELQEYVEGIEMSTEAWFNGNNFILPINSTLEEKPFMNGGIGPNTGCMGNLVWYWDMDTSHKLYDILFKGFEEPLRETGYIGPLDINAIWTDKGPYALEFTARFGYDAIQASSRLLSVPLGEFLASLPFLETVPVRKDAAYAGALRVSVPPYPNDGKPGAIPIIVDENDTDFVYLSDVFYDEATGLLRCAETDGYVLSIAESGYSPHAIFDFLYIVADRLTVPGKQYRTDIGRRSADIRAVKKVIDRTGRVVVH